MIKREYSDENGILEYIGQDYYKCLYLYLNLKKYKFSNANVKIWTQKRNNKIASIILKYYDTMHIFSKNCDYEKEALKILIQNESPATICAPKGIICDIFSNTQNLKIGNVMRLQTFANLTLDRSDRSGIESAKDSDFCEIVRLLQKNKWLESANLEHLKESMLRQNKEGYTRNYIIKEQGNIIAHVATSAESEKIAVISYVVTDENHRKKGYARKLCTALCWDLVAEGKEVFLLNYTNTKLYDKIGFKNCGNTAKYLINI